MVCSGMVRNIYWRFITDVAGQATLGCLTLEEGSDRLSHNVGDKVVMYAGLNPRRAMISYIRAAET